MERKRACRWYLWLWLSPLLTVPTLLILRGSLDTLIWAMALPSRAGSGAVNYRTIVERVAILVAVLGSALWHLMLLIPARDKESAFVRWHGRQALLIAGVRTAIPMLLGLLIGGDGQWWSIPVLLIIWLGGTLWGQRQATRGECSLMRRFGQEEPLSPSQRSAPALSGGEQDAQVLIEIVRFSRDPEERRKAVAELSRRGMVETL